MDQWLLTALALTVSTFIKNRVNLNMWPRPLRASNSFCLRFLVPTPRGGHVKAAAGAPQGSKRSGEP